MYGTRGTGGKALWRTDPKRTGWPKDNPWEEKVDGFNRSRTEDERKAAPARSGEAAREELDKAIASIPGGSADLTVEPILEHGQPEVVLFEQSKDASLVVVGSRGLGGSELCSRFARE